MTELEKLVLALSENRFAINNPLRSEMFEQHNTWLKGDSRFIKRWENVNNRCGSCIRRTQTNLLKHYYDVVWDESSSLELRVIDSQDGRPVFKKKAVLPCVGHEVESQEVETNGSEANVKRPPKEESAPKKRRGRPKKSK